MKVSSSSARRIASTTGFAESPTMPYTCLDPSLDHELDEMFSHV